MPKMTQEEAKAENKTIDLAEKEAKQVLEECKARRTLLQVRCPHMKTSPSGHGGYMDESWASHCHDCDKQGVLHLIWNVVT
jgi:hypothetical protein